MNQTSAKKLDVMLETLRRLYNNTLTTRQESWELKKAGKISRVISFNELSARFTKERETNPFYAKLNAATGHCTIERCKLAYNAHFKRLKDETDPKKRKLIKPPHTKKRKQFNTIDYYYFGNGIQLHALEKKLYIQGVGNVRVKLHRPLVGETKNVKLTKELGNWYLIVACEIETAEPAGSAVEKPSVGIDVGIEYFTTDNNGKHVENPNFLKSLMEKRRLLHRSMSRKTKYGKNWKKVAKQLAKLEYGAKNSRRDFHYKLALELVREFGIIGVEVLDIVGMIKSRKIKGLSKSIYDVGWYSFRQILKHQALKYGSRVVEVPSPYTSQECNRCKTLVWKDLGVRIHSCPNCGFEIHRDINAAMNILEKAIKACAGPCDINLSGSDASDCVTNSTGCCRS